MKQQIETLPSTADSSWDIVRVTHENLPAAASGQKGTRTDARPAASVNDESAQECIAPLLPDSFQDGPVPAFVINADHVITHWNKACEQASGAAAGKMIGTRNQWQPFYPLERPVLADLIVSGAVENSVDNYYHNKFRRTPMIQEAYEAEDFFPHLGEEGRWLYFSAAPLHDSCGRIVGAIETFQDVTAFRLAEETMQKEQVDQEHLAARRMALLAEACGCTDAIRPARKAAIELLSQEEDRLNKVKAIMSSAVGNAGAAEDLAQARMTPALSEFFDGSPVPAFAIDADHVITQWNKACTHIIGMPSEQMVGTRNQWQPFYPRERPVLADLIVSGAVEDMMEAYYHNKFRRSTLIPGAYEAEDFFPHLGTKGRWLFFSAAPLRDAGGRIVGAIETLQDVTKRKLAEKSLHKVQVDLEHLVAKRTAQLAQANSQLEDDIRQREAAEAELLRRNAELTELNAKLSMAQEQLVQSEKLASIGQLAAGVAHEINNPIGYIFSNFGTLEHYLANLLEIITVYEDAEGAIASSDVVAKLKAMREHMELGFLKDDIPVLMLESKEGIVRVRKIVQDLKDFSRVDTPQQWLWADLHQGIDSTLNIVNNEVKYRADIIKEYGSIPEIECLPSQLNQVIMNMVVNAAHAIGTQRGKITIRTGVEGDQVWIEVSDTGSGIAKENLSRIFDPFFTTKPVGKGTGLGLSLSYGIVQKHQGRIDVDSELGKGTTFRIVLPIQQTKPLQET